MRSIIARLLVALMLTVLPVCGQEPVISLHLRESVPSLQQGAVRFAIDIYADGRGTVRRSDATRSEWKISQKDLAGLFAFFKEEGALGLTDAAIDAAIVREAERSGKTNSPYWLAVTHEPYTELKIRQSSNATSVLRYSLPDQVRCQPNVKELRAVQRSVDKIYEVAGEKSK